MHAEFAVDFITRDVAAFFAADDAVERKPGNWCDDLRFAMRRHRAHALAYEDTERRLRSVGVDRAEYEDAHTACF